MASSRFTNRDIPKSKINIASLKRSFRLFNYMSTTNKWLFLLGTIFLAITAGASILFPKLLGDMMDGIFVYKQGGVSTAPSLDKLTKVAELFVYLFIVQAVFSFLRIAIYVRVTENMTFGLRSDLFKSVIHQNMEFHSQNRVGDLLSRFSSDISQIQDTFTTNIAMFIRQLLVMIGGIVLIFMTSNKLAINMLFTVPVIIIIALFFGKFIRKISKEVQDLTAQNNVIVEESISGIINVKAYTNENFEHSRYQKNALNLQKESIIRGYWRGAFSSFIIVCLFGSIVWLIFKGLGLVQTGELAIGELFNFMFLTAFVGGSIGGMAEQFVQIQKTLGAIERVLDIIEMPEESNLSKLSPDFSQAMTFQNIEFAYPSRPENNVLKKINLKLEPGQSVALVGPSGSGKSTIASLIYQFYQPTNGSIILGNQNISDFDLIQYRNNFAYVPQEIVLFGGTIYENILYGNPQASESEVFEAANKANALNFIEDFPEKFQTLVGDRGMKLSGGQKQRIAIARSLYQDAEIILFDEATSALDNETENEIIETINNLHSAKKTLLMIAHRYTTLRKCDRIYEMKNGQIVASHNYDDLIRKLTPIN